MSLRIEARQIYLALSLALVAVAVALGVHTYESTTRFLGRVWFTLFQTLPLVALTLLPLALVLSLQPRTWPRLTDKLANLIVALLFAGTVYLTWKSFDLPTPIQRNRATWTYLYTALRTLSYTVAVATLLASGSKLLARLPAMAYRVVALLVLASGAVIAIKIAGFVQKEHLAAFASSFFDLLMLAGFTLIWTESRLPLEKRIGGIRYVGLLIAGVLVLFGVFLAIKYPALSRGSDFWWTVYGLLPPLIGALCLLVATRALSGPGSAVLIGLGRMVGLCAVVVCLCLARWYAYSFLPGVMDQTWRFLLVACNLVPLSLLLLVQFEALSTEEDPAPLPLPEAPSMSSSAI